MTADLRQEYATPQFFVDRVRDALSIDRFDLDAAATRDNTKADNFFTKQQDGLQGLWSGRVWCNPPYKEIDPWVDKAFAELAAERVQLIAMLLPARTGRPWFHKLLRSRFVDVMFVEGRISFVPPDGVEASHPREFSVVAVFSIEALRLPLAISGVEVKAA